MGEFRNFLMEAEASAGKTDLYPLGYGGIGLYPPAAFINKSPDALYYMSKDDRLYKGEEGGPFSIKHVPGKPSSNVVGKGEGPPFDIRKV